MKRLLAALLVPTLVATSALAHHGVAGVGAAALEGPGAPVESASSAILPEGKTLLYAKLDHAKFKSVDPTDTQVDYNQFWMAGIGHGFTPWLSAYLFAPYNRKIDTTEPVGAATPKFDTRGWADLSFMAQIGFKYDNNGLSLANGHESLDDMEDWHFTVYAGGSLPTGNPNLKNRAGDIDPGKSTGFGKSDWSLGVTATKMLSRDVTFNAELSAIRFGKYRYDGDATRPAGFDYQFGPEDRLNLGLAYRLYANAAEKLRADLSVEMQFLKLGRDAEGGVADINSGGRIIYFLPGVRIYKDSMSFAFGIKTPIWKKLNEPTSLQQGSEGKEKYRLIFSASTMF